jgi:hypothetical protein
VATHRPRYPLYKVLYDVLYKEDPHEWTDKEIAGALKEVTTIATVALRKRLNLTKDGLGSDQQVPTTASQ